MKKDRNQKLAKARALQVRHGFVNRLQRGYEPGIAGVFSRAAWQEEGAEILTSKSRFGWLTVAERMFRLAFWRGYMSHPDRSRD